jgi:PhnB protein
VAAGESLFEEEKTTVMHVELPVLSGHVQVANDMLESQGHSLKTGNNTTINLELDDRAETEPLFRKPSKGGSDPFGRQDMRWGAHWGSCADRFEVR